MRDSSWRRGVRFLGFLLKGIGFEESRVWVRKAIQVNACYFWSQDGHVAGSLGRIFVKDLSAQFEFFFFFHPFLLTESLLMNRIDAFM